MCGDLHNLSHLWEQHKMHEIISTFLCVLIMCVIGGHLRNHKVDMKCFPLTQREMPT
jgi:hypothetical protein